MFNIIQLFGPQVVIALANLFPRTSILEMPPKVRCSFLHDYYDALIIAVEVKLTNQQMSKYNKNYSHSIVNYLMDVAWVVMGYYNALYFYLKSRIKSTHIFFKNSKITLNYTYLHISWNPIVWDFIHLNWKMNMDKKIWKAI